MAESAAPGVVFYSAAAAAVRSDGGGSVEPRVPRGSPTDSGPPPPAAAAADCTLDVTNCLRNGRHLARRPPSPVSLSPRPSGCPARTAIYQIPTQMIHLTPVKHAGYPIRGTESSSVLLPRLCGSPTTRYSSDQTCRCFLRPFPIRFFCIQSISSIRKHRYIMIDQSIRNCLKWP